MNAFEETQQESIRENLSLYGLDTELGNVEAMKHAMSELLDRIDAMEATEAAAVDASEVLQLVKDREAELVSLQVAQLSIARHRDPSVQQAMTFLLGAMDRIGEQAKAATPRAGSLLG